MLCLTKIFKYRKFKEHFALKPHQNITSPLFSSSENYYDSMNDAKVATDLQPSLVKAIVGGEISKKITSRFTEAAVASRVCCDKFQILNSA